MSSMFDGGGKPLGRIRAFQGVVIFLFCLYALRLFNMQIISGEQYRRRSYDIARQTIVLPARRGEIYDRTFTNPIVVNEDSFAVNLTPAEVPEGGMLNLLRRLSDLLNISQKELEEKVPPSYYHLYQPLELEANVSFEVIAILAENADSLPGISWQSKPVRNYGDIGSLAHIIGYTGNITQEELILLYNQGYKQGDVIGKLGIEREYDSILRGREGFESKTVDVRGRRMGEQQRRPPEMGKNLVLTIDRNIQTLTEKALGQRIGTAIVMRPNGEILAMVSYPWYDPNIFNRRDVNREYQRLLSNPNNPFLNRAIQANYPPASTFKVLMSTALLSERPVNFSPEQRISCTGKIDYGQRPWNCWSIHGWVNLQQALAGSCDIYFWTVGRDNLGVDRIVRFAHDFGYGEETGVDLPGEASGFIPTTQWKENIYHERWVAGDTMNMSIGQGFNLVTPLQMSNMVAMVINDGVNYRPHILKEVRDPATRAIEKAETPEIINNMQDKVNPQVFATVRQQMRTVVTEGSASNVCNIRTVQIAGKTGTAEVGLSDRYHYWFTAYGPYNTDNHDEQIIVTVLVEASNPLDEWWSPYATSIIFQGIYANQTYEEALVSLGLQSYSPQGGRRE